MAVEPKECDICESRQQRLLQSPVYSYIPLSEVQLKVPADVKKLLNSDLSNYDFEISKLHFTKGGTDVLVTEYELHIVSYGTGKEKNSKGKWITKKVKTSESVKIKDSCSINCHFFYECCSWVVDKIEDVLKGKLKINIVLDLHRLPARGLVKFVKFLFNKDYSDVVNMAGKRIHLIDFFRELKEFQSSVIRYEFKNVQHKNLTASLRPYQVKAVQWMINRENNEFTADKSGIFGVEKFELNGKTLYFHPYTGSLTHIPKEEVELPKYFRGGILADEMGLGKTVVVISLMLSNPRKIEEKSDFLIESAKPVKKEADKKKTGSKKLKSEPVVTEEIDLSNDEDLDKDDADFEPPGKKLRSKRGKNTELAEPSKKTRLKRELSADLFGPTSKKSKKGNLPVHSGVIGGESVKCTCGKKVPRPAEECVQCPSCNFYQHVDCVNYRMLYDYFCMACWEEQDLIKSKATMIIVPQSIYYQWKDELIKHVRQGAWEKGVYKYEGVRNGYVQPSVLASYDVVVTTYDVLTEEFAYTTSKRKAGLFMMKRPPIFRVEWWRVCLDEAQMVDEGVIREGKFVAARMAASIPAVNRWNVTGTPINYDSVDDLYYLISWIGVKPFNDKFFWRDVLYKPFENGYKVPLYTFLGQIFWRNTKDSVAEELLIPPQTTIFHKLKFSAIESMFYMREHESVAKRFADELEEYKDLNQTLDSLSMKNIASLLRSVLNLRQACSHFLAVRNNEVLNELNGNKKSNGDDYDIVSSYMTLEALSKYLQEKTKKECDGSLKSYLEAMTGLAGSYYALREWLTALQNYQTSLETIEEYEKKELNVDPLQKIHFHANLGELLFERSEMKYPTGKTAEHFNKIAEDLEEKYLEKTEIEFKRNLQIFLSTKEELDKISEISDDPWVILANSFTKEEWIARVKSGYEGDDENDEIAEFLLRVSGNLEKTVADWLEKVKTRRETVSDLYSDLCDAELRDESVKKASNMKLFKNEMKEKRKYLSECKSVFTKYEDFLFSKGKTSEDKATQPHRVEVLMRLMLRFSKTKNNVSLGSVRNCEKYLEFLDACKQEYRQIRTVLKSLKGFIKEKEKLILSKLRNERYSLDEYDYNEFDNKEERARKDQLRSQMETAIKRDIYQYRNTSQEMMSALRKKYGTFLYLTNLDKIDGEDRDPCPICFGNLETTWCVLQCGHSYCIPCVKELLKEKNNANGDNLECPMCREKTRKTDIGFVDVTMSTCIEGNHSTKIKGIVEALLDLKRSDPDVKVLIVSSWDIVLDVLKEALVQNRISYKMPSKMDDSGKKIEEFKNGKITALLLPISYGWTGLNLTEATHIFITEPILNPAEEQQAIARIHRMGQTRKTYIHRFIISGTIEEKIQSAVSGAEEKWIKSEVTLNDLKNLFQIEKLNE